MKKAPLEGIRVIEHGQLLAVPYPARLLADLGAEVIKVESPIRLDTHRQTIYPDNDPGNHFWDRGGTFYSENRGKYGITLDLRHADAVQAFKDLARVSDVVMENFTTRVMKGFGLDYESLREVNPNIIYFSSTGYGHTGPWANFRAVGPTTEAASGVASTTGYAGGSPVLADIPYTDYIAAEQGAYAILLALYRRKRTGRGGAIDLSQVEAQAALAGELFLDASANGTQTAPKGNRHSSLAPPGFFRCAGSDRWIAIAVSSDGEWQGLQKAMGNPDWAADTRFATVQGRLDNADEIEPKLTGWTQTQEAMPLMKLLQDHGVPAGVAFDGRDIVLNEHYRARGFMAWADHPPGSDIEPKPYPGVPWRFSESDRGARRGGPGLGQHNEYVLCDLLGYSRDKLAEMKASGALGGDPEDFPRPRPVSLEVLQRQSRAREIDPEYRQRLQELARDSMEQPAAPERD
jgi:benzylsuccinate CoA-transferase BbsF subunit